MRGAAEAPALVGGVPPFPQSLRSVRRHGPSEALTAALRTVFRLQFSQRGNERSCEHSASQFRTFQGMAASPCWLLDAQIVPQWRFKLQLLEPQFSAPSGHHSEWTPASLGQVHSLDSLQPARNQRWRGPTIQPEEGKGQRPTASFHAATETTEQSQPHFVQSWRFLISFRGGTPAHSLVNCPPQDLLPKEITCIHPVLLRDLGFTMICGDHRGNYTAMVFVFPF